VIFSSHIEATELENAFISTTPAMFNVTEFFTLESKQIVFKKQMRDLDAELNKDLFQELKNMKNVTPFFGNVSEKVRYTRICIRIRS